MEHDPRAGMLRYSHSNERYFCARFFASALSDYEIHSQWTPKTHIFPLHSAAASAPSSMLFLIFHVIKTVQNPIHRSDSTRQSTGRVAGAAAPLVGMMTICASRKRVAVTDVPARMAHV